MTHVKGKTRHSCALTFMPPNRHLPRIRLRRTSIGWSCRWISQNGSYLENQRPRLVQAVHDTLSWRRYQRWPLIVWVIDR